MNMIKPKEFLMRFWKKKCENFIYEINYEDIVNNSEHEIRKLLNYCELG